jgi:hypothetical protein
MDSWTIRITDNPSGRSTAMIALTIGRFLFTTASWSNPATFALLVLWTERTSHPYPKTQVSAPPSKILMWYFSGRWSRFIHLLCMELLMLSVAW